MGRNGQKKSSLAKHSSSSNAIRESVADKEDDGFDTVYLPTWMPMPSLGDPETCQIFIGPRKFYDEMMHSKDLWSLGANKETAQCVANAIWKIVTPWIVHLDRFINDMSNYLLVACEVAHKQAKHITQITDAINLLNTVNSSYQTKINELETRLKAIFSKVEQLERTVIALEAQVNIVEEWAPAGLSGRSRERVAVSIQRAQKRAEVSRSPDPKLVARAARTLTGLNSVLTLPGGSTSSTFPSTWHN